MGLVALIIDIEEALGEAGYNMILTAERAMSAAQSPFKDVPSLVAYIEELSGRLSNERTHATSYHRCQSRAGIVFWLGHYLDQGDLVIGCARSDSV